MFKNLGLILSAALLVSCAGMISELPYNKPFQAESKILGDKTVGVRDIPCENSITFDLLKKTDTTSEAKYFLVPRVPAGFVIESMKMKVDKDLISLTPVSNSNVDYNLRESKMFVLERETLEKMFGATEIIFGLNGHSTYLEEQCMPTKITMKDVNAKYGIEMFRSADVAKN